MPKYTWIIATLLSGLVLLGVLALSHVTNRNQLHRATTTLADAQSALAQSQAAAEELKQKLAESEARLDSLKSEKETATQARQSLEEEMRAALQSRDVTISQLQGKLTVNILDRVLFDSGEADLKPEGAVVLRRVADVLTQHTNLRIHVIGHTDNVPIHRKYPSNWELSAARAIAAVRFLSESAGVNAQRLAAVGYGEFRPVGDNGTAEGRAQNRRIEISVFPEESFPEVKPVAAAKATGATEGPNLAQPLPPAVVSTPDAVR